MSCLCLFPAHTDRWKVVNFPIVFCFFFLLQHLMQFSILQFSRTESLLLAKFLIPTAFAHLGPRIYSGHTLTLHVCTYRWNLTMENTKYPWWFLAGKIRKKGSKLQFAVALVVLPWAQAMLYTHGGRQITDCSLSIAALESWFCESQGGCPRKTL